MVQRPEIRLSAELYHRAQERARLLGLSSVDAYVTQLLERDLHNQEDEAQRLKILERMQGLGYLA